MSTFVTRSRLSRPDGMYWSINIILTAGNWPAVQGKLEALEGFFHVIGWTLHTEMIAYYNTLVSSADVQITLGEAPSIQFRNPDMQEGWEKFLKGL